MTATRLHHLSASLALSSVAAMAYHLPGWASASLVGGSYLSYCGAVWRAHRQAQQQADAAASGNADTLIAVASQTGYAATLAEKTSALLQEAGIAHQCVTLNQLSAERLAGVRRLLCIVSTTGEGDAPDNASRFCRDLLPQRLALPDLSFAVLALGDRHYQQFCAFGHQLAHWLDHCGAHRLSDLIEVDNGDDAALRHWQQELGRISGYTLSADWSAPDYADWILTERRLLNPGSVGAPAYHLILRPAQGNGDWQAGDIAEIRPQRPGQPDDQTLPHREYSVSSVAADGQLELLVRQLRKDDGSLGLGSGWLTEYAAIGQTIGLRIRRNPQFHTPDCKGLILIGNGSGLAGLRSHLKQRERDGRHQNWLIFGERQRATDFFHQEEILHWQDHGHLSRLDLCFSRDQASRRYVQHALAEQADMLRQWIDDGAAILVCGSLQGMGEDVHQTLLSILGEPLLDALSDSGRYRRDVY